VRKPLNCLTRTPQGSRFESESSTNCHDVTLDEHDTRNCVSLEALLGMHMADALISPAVGGTMWVATAATTVYCARKVRAEHDESKIPLMGVAGAFIFGAQMLNFTIPGTGSSGHLGGGLILAILLGPEAAFLVMASVLGVQALFFADGGLLALGANIFNLAFFPAFVAHPLVYRPLTGADPSARRVVVASIAAALVGVELGALGVVLETTLSGITALPFSAFAAVVLPIHLVIGLVEGFVTAAVVLFVLKAQPEILSRGRERSSLAGVNLRPVLIGLGSAALLAVVVLASYASTNPDGLEWSIARVTGGAEIQSSSAAHDVADEVQERTALFPGYERPDTEEGPATQVSTPSRDTLLAGLVGAVVVLCVAALAGATIRRRRAAASRH